MLTATAIKNAKPKAKPYKLADGGGMYLEVSPSGAKYWRLKYRIKGKESRISLGVYPGVSLLEARTARDAAKKLIKAGIDPAKGKQRTASLPTFEEVAREWHEKNKDGWSTDYSVEIIKRLEDDVFPEIGQDAISTITAADLLKCVRKIEDRGAREVAKRCLQKCGQVFRYAIATSRADRNPATDLAGALKPVVRGHFAAIGTDDLPKLKKAITENAARLFPATIRAIRLMMLTLVRTSELIEAEKTEINTEAHTWVIPASRMKMKKEHIVPLSKQAMEIVKAQMAASNSKYLFPHQSDTNKHMSNNTVLFALYRLGYKGKMTGHGFRALGLSTIKEALGYRHEVVDRQLAHVPGNKVDRAYDRAKFLPERKKMMREWADYLDGL